MGIAEKIAAYRLEMLRRLKNEDGHAPPPEVAKAKQTIADFEKRDRDRKVQAKRLQSEPAEAEDCPACQARGIKRRMAAQPHRGDNVDFVRCGACGLEIEV